jgi:hypothetical protein
MRFGWSVFRSFVLIAVAASATWAVLHSQLGTNCPHALRADDGTRVDAAMFGVEMPGEEDGSAFFVETSRVPLVTGATFGWRIHLADDAPAVLMREELVLPGAPRVWRHEGDTAISEDRRVAVTERVVRTWDGWLENYWSFTDGDPEGLYTLRVYVDDELAREFTFRVDRVDGTRVGKGCGKH